MPPQAFSGEGRTGRAITGRGRDYTQRVGGGLGSENKAPGALVGMQDTDIFPCGKVHPSRSEYLSRTRQCTARARAGFR